MPRFMADDFKLEGLDAAMAKLRALGDPKRIKSAVRSASTKAMRQVRDSARANARGIDDPETASVIWKKIVTQYRSRQSKGDKVTVSVGVQGGAKPVKGNKDTGHWRFLELGREGVAAQPFMRPALESNIGKVSSEFVASLEPAIDKIIARGK